MARKQRYHYIYKTTNLLSGKYYIGIHSTNNLDDGYMGSGKRLRYSINKYGKGNHTVEILEFLNTREELKSREVEIVNLNEIAKEDCMNLKVGGEGGFSIETQRLGGVVTAKILKERFDTDEEFREKCTKARSNNIAKLRDKGLVQYDNRKGTTQTEETKNKISISKKGRGLGKTNFHYGSRWITKDGYNKKVKGDEVDDFIKQGWELGRVRG